MKTTGWYPASVNPKRVGFYETLRWFAGSNKKQKLLWTGKHWEYAHGNIASMTNALGDKWRGLTEKVE